MDTVRDIHGVKVLICAAESQLLARESDATHFISAAWQQNAALVAIPVARLDPGFFRLSTRLAGESVQKFVNYNIRIAVVGDFFAWTAARKPPRDFECEANRGPMKWLVAHMKEFEQQLAPTLERTIPSPALPNSHEQ